MTVSATSNYSEILALLLDNLQWKGHTRQLQEALPPDHEHMDINDLRDTLSHLGFSSMICRLKPHELLENSFPLLYLDKKGEAQLLLNRLDSEKLENKTSSFLTFRKTDTLYLQALAGTSILRREIGRFMPLLREIFLISLIVGALTLAPIIYNRSIYDHLIAAGSSDGFGMMLTGVMLALGAEIYLRYMRNRRLSFFGGRLDHYVSCSVFERLLFLPPIFTERSTTSAQIARLKDFESVREFFTGPLATLFFEFPLTVIYLVVMAIMSGWLAMVPIVLMGCYVALILGMGMRLKLHARLAAATSTKRQEFLLETITKLRDVRTAGLENIWQERYRTLSDHASMASFQSAYSAQILETLSYALMILGGMATLTFGVIMVIDQTITVGTLIASMMLIWRIIAPMQICCASLTRIQQLSSSLKQVERMMSVAPEHDPNSLAVRTPALKGAISFHRVSVKYSPESEPALLGVSCQIKPGQIIAIKGNNGSGKSTFLKLMLGLYQPQAGSVRFDNMDIRQFDPLSLRQNISYIPQDSDFFPGTIRENFVYSNPEASESDITQALIESCALEDVENLPQQLDTPIQSDNFSVISFALRQKLNLARAYIRKAPIYLFDEASYSLGRENDLAFAEKIKALRGRATVIMATHREDHMKLADQLLFLNKGELTHAGPPQQVLNVLKGKQA